MKSKNYWDKSALPKDPFEVPKRVSRSVAAIAKKFQRHPDRPGTVKYVWIYVTEDGLRRRRDCGATPCMRLDEWLNVIDESAALGADWMVVYVGASLSTCPEVWRMCEWAQSEHGLRVGIHVASCEFDTADIESLLKLDLDRTYVVAECARLSDLRALEARGVRLCEANVRPEDRMSPCSNPEAIACVGIDGRLFTCGLVLGDRAYDLGNVLDRGLGEVLRDTSLPHVIPHDADYHEHGCDGCPPHMAKRVMQALSE